MALRAVLFDLDDTLTDRGRSIEKLAPHLMRQFGLDRSGIGLDEIVQCIRTGDGNGYAMRRELCEHLQTKLRWTQVPSIDQLVAFWVEWFPRCNVEREGVTPMLGGLQRRGLKMAIITNGARTQHVKIDVMGIRPYFSTVLVSDEIGIKKPDARIFRAALEQLGVAASEAVFVGDNPELDIAGAQGLGMRAVWLKCREEAAPPDAECITSFDQLAAIL